MKKVICLTALILASVSCEIDPYYYGPTPIVVPIYYSPRRYYSPYDDFGHTRTRYELYNSPYRCHTSPPIHNNRHLKY